MVSGYKFIVEQGSLFSQNLNKRKDQAENRCLLKNTFSSTARALTLSRSGIFSLCALWVCEKNEYVLLGSIISNCTKSVKNPIDFSYTSFPSWRKPKATQILITFGCLMPKMKPHSDKSSEISQPTSSYCASWWMRFVDGWTMMRATPVLSLPLSSRAQCAGVSGALLSHLFVDSERIPTTPFPSMVYII